MNEENGVRFLFDHEEAKNFVYKPSNVTNSNISVHLNVLNSNISDAWEYNLFKPKERKNGTNQK